MKFVLVERSFFSPFYGEDLYRTQLLAVDPSTGEVWGHFRAFPKAEGGHALRLLEKAREKGVIDPQYWEPLPRKEAAGFANIF